jgi:hypothetical protein
MNNDYNKRLEAFMREIRSVTLENMGDFDCLDIIDLLERYGFVRAEPYDDAKHGDLNLDFDPEDGDFIYTEVQE